MYYLLGLEKNLETIATVSKSFLKCEGKQLTFSTLKSAYFQFTQYTQPKIPISNNVSEVTFVNDVKLQEQLIEIFLDRPIKGTNHRTISNVTFNGIDKNQELISKYDLVRKSLRHYKERNENLHFLTQLLFTYIFAIKINGVACATIPKALGLLLIDHKLWNINDMCEMLVHETTHQLVTLDEYRYEYYLNQQKLFNPENYCISTLRKTKRPVNKVIHSLIVAYEIINYRKNILASNENVTIHPGTDILKKQIFKTLESLDRPQIKNNLSTRAIYLIDLIASATT